jgi:hypothetical protein
MTEDNEYCEKHCKGYRDTGGRCFADGRCDAYWEYQKQKGTMENMEKALYRVRTRGCGIFYVIATSFDCAVDEVTNELNAQDYGFSGQRVVTSVDFICRQTFMSNGKRALYGDNDENHLMISKEK